MNRAITEHWVWDFASPDKTLAWIDLLLLARHTDGRMMIKNRVVNIKRGEVGVSQLALQKRWKWSQNKVKRFLKLLENDSMIELKTNDLTTIISICNYDSYQYDERTDERTGEREGGRPVERHADDQSNEDIRMKEGKEGKKETHTPSADGSPAEKPAKPNITITELKKLHPEIPSERIAEWFVVREGKRLKKLPRSSWTHILSEFEKAGLTPSEGMHVCIKRGWAGFESSWYANLDAGSRKASSLHKFENVDYDYGVNPNGSF